VKELTTVRRAAASVARVTDKLEQARGELRDAILAADAAAATLPMIAAAAGLTKQRVHQIIREETTDA
jgi:K+-transporting ATPase c subunit